MKDKITIVSTSDWTGIYKNGELIDQDHSLDVKSVLKAMGLDVTSHGIDDDVLVDHGYGFPENLSDIQKHIL